MRKFRFTPQQLLSFTVAECFGLYLEAIIDESNAQNPKDDKYDDQLAPHKADEMKAQLDRQMKEALAYDSMTVEQRLIMGRRLYGG